MTAKRALIIVNTGSPECSISSIKTFLKLFLTDKHVIRIPKALWYPILYGFILRRRPYALLKKYQKITIDGKTPLIFYEQNIIKKLQIISTKLNIKPFYANLYSPPYIEDVLKICLKEEISEIKVLPLFAQYSTVTTKAVIDKFQKHIKSSCKISFVTDFYADPLYIKALLKNLSSAKINADTPLLLAYHSLPKSYLKKDNLYIKQCIATSELIAQAIERRCPVYTVFVSQFGKGKWLGPSLTDTLQQLKNKNIKIVNLMSPGFMLDCLETLYDIKKTAFAYGRREGLEINYFPCLNDSDECIELITSLVRHQ